MEERKTRLIHDLQDHIRYLSELGAEFIAAPDTSPGPAASSGPDLGALEALIRRCEKCPLSQTRTQAVPGEGSAQADLMFIGEGPGHDEDAQGLPFVDGPASSSPRSSMLWAFAGKMCTLPI